MHPTAETSYHHGDLKKTLLDAYFELLESVAPTKLSLRKIAAHVGVAPTAVYNHYADKDALKTAVRIRVLDHFADFLKREIDQNVSPKDRIKQLGKAYFHYSQRHPQFFEILFSETVPDEYVTDELIEAGMRAEELLRRAVTDLLVSHDIPASQYNEGLGAFACWSIAHGVTSLTKNRINQAACITNRWPPEFMLTDEASVDKTFDDLGNILVAGILATTQST